LRKGGKKKKIIQGNFYEELERYVKRPCKQSALSTGATVGQPRGAF
jgi:hypothetical protein